MECDNSHLIDYTLLSCVVQGDTGAVVGSFIEMHVMTVIVAIIQVRITMVGIRAPPGIMVVEVIGVECK